MKKHTTFPHVAVIDTSIEDYQTLEQAALEAGLEVIQLEASGDGIESLAASLEGIENIGSLHIFSHGDAGTLTLGDDVLTAQNLDDHAEALSIISGSLSEDADLLLYGCRVGADENGVNFVNKLALLSGADIAASNDLTGNSKLGGDWELEVVTGNIESAQTFSEQALADFSTVLFTGTINFSTVTTAGSLGGANSINAQFGGAGGYTLVLDGSNASTYGGFGRGYSSAGESQVTLHFSGGETFTPTSIYIYNISGSADTFTVTSNVGGSVSSGSLSDTNGTTLNISSFGAGVSSVYITVQDSNGYFSIDNFAVTSVGPANNVPAISVDNSTLAYTENNSATQIDSAATVSDADGDADWNGGTLVAQITGNAESGDRMSIVDSDGDGTAITISGTNIFANGIDIGDLSASGGIVTGGTALTITFDSDATNANVQEVLQSLRYDSTTNDPGTSNRTITLTATDKSAGSNADTRAVSVTAVNDEPTLTASASNPTFTEGGAAASLFTGTSINTVETGQNITGLSFTITNVTNGSNERINVDGTTIVLTHGTNGSTAGNSLNYSVMVIGTTATVTMTGGNLSVAAAETMLDNMSYQNNSNSPSTSNRVVTLTSIQDSGGTANGGDNTGSLAVASTVTVVQNNDEPTLTANGSNPTFTEGGAATGLFSGTSISTVEAGQTINGFTFTVSNVANGTSEVINIDGTAIALTHGTSGSTAGNSLSYSVSVVGTTATVALTGGTMSTATAQTLLDNLSYQNNSDAPSTSNRVVTLTSIQDSGGTANGGDDTASISVASTVTMVGVNDEPTLTASASNPTFTEGGAAASLFTGTSINTVETGQNITGLSFTITNVTNGSNERINVDGTTIVLTHGTNGSTAGNSLNYSVMVIGTTATVTMTGGNLSVAAAETMLGNMSYQNNSNSPSTSNRVVTLTSIQDSGGTANGGDNTGSLAVASTVTVTQNNDEPTLTANGSNPTFTEGGAAASLFSGTSISTVEAGQTINGFTFTVSNVANGTSEVINIDGTAIALTHGTSGSTAGNSLSYSVSVVGTTATVALTGGTMSTATAQTLLDNLSYQNNSDAPSTSNRVVTLTSIQDSGGTANGGDDTASISVASTVTMVGVNDEPTLTASASNPTFTEGGAAASLFTGTSINTVETGQNITGLSFTITNVTNGSNERINVDGTTIVLTHGTNGSTAGNSLNYSVMVIGTTATVTMTGGNLSIAAAETMLDNMSYQNNSNSPSTSNRVVTLTSIQDSGGTANGGDNTGSLAVASTVTVVQNNDEPTLTANGSNPTFTEGGAAASLFSGTSISTVEAGQTINGFTFTVSNVANGTSEVINIDGSAIVLTHGTSGSTAGNSLSYSVSVVGTTATVALTGGTMSTATAQTLLDNLSYQNNSDAPSTSNRVVTLTSIQDSGGTANGGDDTASISVASTVTMVGVNDEPTLTASASNPTFTEGGAAASLFTGTSINTVETGQNITGLSFTITNVTNGSNERINADGTTIVLTHGTNGSTAGNSLNYSVMVIGTTATVTMTGGNLSVAAAETMLDNMSYQNNSNSPSTSNRVVTLTSIQDSGGTANGGDNTGSLAISSTVAVVTAPVPPAPPSNGGSDDIPPPTTTDTVDGVERNRATESDGSTTTTIPFIDDSREDDPTTKSAGHADIPILADTNGKPILTVSLPTGVGLTVNGQAEALGMQAAVNDLIERIEQKVEVGSNQHLEMTVHGQDFMASLASNDTVVVQTIAPTISGDQAPNVPIIITASNDLTSRKQALVIDASSLPSGTILQLDNVTFAAVIGTVRVVGGTGQNFVIGDDQNQFIVLGADDDILFGGSGDDTVGSLGGNDQTSGDAGNDIVYGGSAHDIISGGVNNDRLNGGFGFDIALQEGKLSDYQVVAQGNSIILTHTNGTTDTITDVELVHFTNGPSLAIAHSKAEAVAHHLVKTWLGRDLTVAEGNAVQNWQGTDVVNIALAFQKLPEAAVFRDKTTEELLAGLDDNPDIIQLNVKRNIIGGDADDQGYLPLGLALNVNGGGGHDVLKIHGSRDDVYIKQVHNIIEITRLKDGAMLNLSNAEMIAFDSGEKILLAHDQVEANLGRLFQAFFDRDATTDEWQLGREALVNSVNPGVILNWFQSNASLNHLTDTDYVQILYQQALGRTATETEIEQHVSQLENGDITREWLAVDIVNNDEAATIIGNVQLIDGI